MTNTALRGKPDAGNPHVRFDEGEVAPAATPRRGSLLYNVLKSAKINKKPLIVGAAAVNMCGAALADAVKVGIHETGNVHVDSGTVTQNDSVVLGDNLVGGGTKRESRRHGNYFVE